MKNLVSLNKLCMAVAVALGMASGGQAAAQAYPTKPIRIVVPSAAGGGTDVVGRLVGQKLAVALEQPVVIDNRAGSAGNIGHEVVAKSPPDGYTLLVVNPGFVANISLYRKLSYDPAKDFTPITQVATMPYVLAINQSLPPKTVQELVTFAKSKKGGLTYASAGTGQLAHLGMELLKSIAGFEGVHVPYKGDVPALTDVIGGQVDAAISAMVVAGPQVKAKKVKALAVTTLHRSPLLPDVPTVAESGFPGFEVAGWFGLMAPAGTPREIVTRLHNETAKLLKLPDVKESMAANGLDPVGSTPEEFAAYLTAQTNLWAKVIKESGARAD